MAKIMINLIELIGIADKFPTNPKYFTELSAPETLTIPVQKPDMEQILSVMMEAEVISTRLVETDKAVSNEGQNLTGCKLVMELRLHEKVKYVADEPRQSVHVAEFTSQYKSVFVIIPCSIDGVDMCEYIRKNKVTVTPYIEDIYAEMTDARTIFKNITILVDVTIRSL